MAESTKTLNCANCGVPILPTGEGYTHAPDAYMTDCKNPSPTKTTTKPVTQTRHTTPPPFAAFSCLIGHTYRVVLERNRPIALECVNCATMWKTERVEREQP
jgi:hypothetical protein